MPRLKTNPTCKACPKAYNAINGLRCTILSRYVERTQQPPCKTPKPQQI